MEFRLLGALEVRDGGRRVALGAGRQRAVLAILLLHANQVVASDRLVDELWAGRPPGNARKALQVYVFRLRRTLGAERIRTRPSGYLLEVGPDELDVHRFERLVLEARALRAGGEATRAAAALREALGLWDGPALADFTYQQFAQNEIARLEELRLVALEERIDADLRAGEGANLVGELEALVAEHPYRERLRGQTMLALYRAGRQAEALAAYQQTRALLVDELGIEPSPALQRLEVAILHQEPELEPPPPVEPQPRLKGLDTPVIEVVPEAGLPPLPELAAQRRPRVSPQTMVLGAVAGIGVVAVLIALLISRVLGEDFLPRVDANSVG
jgi:DNA-binding SARP family transcriptional activator